MKHELGRKNLQNRRKDISKLNSNKEILIPTETRTKSKYGYQFHIMTKTTNEYKHSFFA